MDRLIARKPFERFKIGPAGVNIRPLGHHSLLPSPSDLSGHQESNHHTSDQTHDANEDIGHWTDRIVPPDQLYTHRKGRGDSPETCEETGNDKEGKAEPAQNLCLIQPACNR
ncbi:MAG: hypothetical protein R3E18_00810 [Sphingomonadaceae bacterium]|nr:hypothetical protein [Sphingomonadaceae bacterium]